MQCARINVTWKPEQFPYLVVERAINVSPVDGGIERKVLPVFSFKVFKVCVPGCAVPEKNKKDTKDFAALQSDIWQVWANVFLSWKNGRLW